jgi:hypothetical protein
LDLNFDDKDSVAAWVKARANATSAAATLHIKLSKGLLTGRSREAVVEYFAERDAAAGGFQSLEARTLRVREVSASESAAAAAGESARHAKDAVTWARWAVIMAVVALIVSAWPAIERLLSP